MIPTPEKLEEIGGRREGSLRATPFAALLLALAARRLTGAVEMRRKQIGKRIAFEHGVPVDCRSNLVHETLGRYMVSLGKLAADDLHAYLGQSASMGRPLGEVLLEHDVVTAEELYKLLQQNLAKKVLDVFTWPDGEFRVLEEGGSPESPLKIRVPQLVVTGITKFAPQAEVDAGVVPLVGKKLCLHPEPPFALDEIRLTQRQSQVAVALRSGWRIDELALGTGMPFEEITRLLYALALLGVVVTTDHPAAKTASRTARLATTPVSAPPAGPPSAAGGATASVAPREPQAATRPMRTVAMPTVGAPMDATPSTTAGLAMPGPAEAGLAAAGPATALGEAAPPHAPVQPGVAVQSATVAAPPAAAETTAPRPATHAAAHAATPPTAAPAGAPAAGAAPLAGAPASSATAAPTAAVTAALAGKSAARTASSVGPSASAAPGAPASAAPGSLAGAPAAAARGAAAIAAPDLHDAPPHEAAVPGEPTLGDLVANVLSAATPPAASASPASLTSGAPPSASSPSSPGPAPAAASPPAPAPPDPAAAERRRNEIMQAYLSYRRLDAFDLLGVDEDASPATVEGKYLETAHRFAPWALAGAPGLADMEEKARDIFLATSRAYAELLDLEQRNALLFRRKAKRDDRARRSPAEMAIKTDLLDPEVQYRKGRALLDAGKFQEAAVLIEFASDCDPQNGLYSAELAYCRFCLAPGQGARALKELEETLRRDADCGLAVYYSGEVHRQMGNREEAEKNLRRAIKMMAPDRRPIEALKLLSAEKRR